VRITNDLPVNAFGDVPSERPPQFSISTNSVSKSLVSAPKAYRNQKHLFSRVKHEIAESITKFANKIGSRTFSELSYKFLRTAGSLE
jgi:hypothetical protein